MTKEVRILRDAVEKAVDKPDYTNPELIIQKLREALAEADAVKDEPTETQSMEEGPLLLALDNYEKYLVKWRGLPSNAGLDAAFDLFRDALEELVRNDT